MPTRTRSVTVAAIVAVVFGLLTIVAGGRALFGGADIGAVMPFVLWFNFAAGFANILAGLGHWYRTSWPAGLSIAIALATEAVFATFLWQVWRRTAYEARTMGAMGLRCHMGDDCDYCRTIAAGLLGTALHGNDTALQRPKPKLFLPDAR